MIDKEDDHGPDIFTAKHLEAYLREQWKSRGVKLKARQRMGLSIKDVETYSRRRNAKTTKPYVDLWVAIFDEFISWQISLFTVVWTPRQELSNLEKSVSMILSKTIADALAIRKLIATGFDIQAKILARSTGEYLELLVCILNEPSLADEFVLTDVPERAHDFWLKHLAKGAVRKKMKAAWSAFFRFEPENEGTAKWFSNWGNSWMGDYSALLHPSFAGGFFSAVPLKTSYPEENWLGFLGDKSDGSVDTVRSYAAYMFPLLLLNADFPFSQTQPNHSYDDNNEHHRHVKIGRHLLASLILSLGSEANQKYIEPEIDLSIFAHNEAA